jgi:hypothetical protein
MEKDENKPVSPEDFRRSGGDDGGAFGKDPATNNNIPFEEGQFETEHPEPMEKGTQQNRKQR